MIILGVDVGNSTTEAVVVDTVTSPPRVLTHDRAPTRGAKGSLESLQGAAILVTRLARRVGRKVDLVVAAPHRPVTTGVVARAEAVRQTGRLDVVAAAGDTPGRPGTAVGTPRWATAAAEATPDAVVLLVPPEIGFRAAVDHIERWRSAGAEVAGVLLADDEGVLVASRLGAPVPVADRVDVQRVAGGVRVAFEVGAAGHALQALGDPIRLRALLGLTEDEHDDALTASTELGDLSRGVVVLHASASSRPRPPAAVIARSHREVDDTWSVDLREVATSVASAVDGTTAREVVVATLRSLAPTDPGPVLGELVDAPVRVIDGEPRAARAGAMSTAGVRAGALVVDLGGGSIDVITATGAEVVLAGAGELLTVSVARFLGLPLGAADWIKRGPCARVENPQVILSEDGTRSFLDRPADSGTVGQLAVLGPTGLLSFGGAMAPSQWRALRRRLKERVIADNVTRALATVKRAHADTDLVLVGGAAGDEELLGLLRGALPHTVVGRADVGGGLGHRFAVAYGLALLAAEGST